MSITAIINHTPVEVLIFEGVLILSLMFIIGDLVPMIWKIQRKKANP